MSSDFRVSRNGLVLTVTLGRAEALNALHPDVHVHLDKLWDDFAADTSLRVGILTGAGDRAFCVGSDLKAYDAGHQAMMPYSGWAGLTNRVRCPKPIIAAVNGLALGSGLESCGDGRGNRTPVPQDSLHRSLEGETLAAISKLEDGPFKRAIMTSQDFREGVRAFVEKRAPVWQEI